MPLDEFQQMTLYECVRQQGCPLCRATWRMDAARFSWYVNDGVLDEETRRNVVRALGFCAPHALYLSLIEGNGFLWSHLGSCMVYVDVIKHALLPKLERVLSRSGQRFLHSFISSRERYSLRYAISSITISVRSVSTSASMRRPIESSLRRRSLLMPVFGRRISRLIACVSRIFSRFGPLFLKGNWYGCWK